ncbi:MAG: hypothetical protein KatS3mg068_1314 [Candidatus Sericytochromatia bacterium]|nr:MAG: hypothetical protein KatS3mg068_1314 [Candidatus Sericytochromatia bacterium]
MNKVVFIMNLNQKNYCKGLSLVEIIISFTILIFIFLLIYNSLISIQSFSEKQNKENIFKLESNIIFQNLNKDLKEAVALFDNKTINIDSFKYNYLKNPDKIIFTTLNETGNSLLIIKFSNKEFFNNREVNTYKLICYYPEINNQNLYLKRIESNQNFYNIQDFSKEELEENSNKLLFEIPLNIYKPKLPENINKLNFYSKTLSKNLVPINFKYNNNYYIYGGFEIFSSYKNFYISIYMFDKNIFSKFNYSLDIR